MEMEKKTMARVYSYIHLNGDEKIECYRQRDTNAIALSFSLDTTLFLTDREQVSRLMSALLVFEKAERKNEVDQVV